ncbi:MAG: RNA-binding protein [Clostridia bacterium]|nr:RNA-binding protein [Clostridia bacterium]
MTDDEKLLIKRLTELSLRAYNRNIPTYSGFLTLTEQSALIKTKAASSFTLWGGYPAAERKVACFGEDSEASAPISLVKIAPSAPKFAEKLTHRDFLGSLMGLGIKREFLGDIVIYENCAFLFCISSIVAYIKETLASVRRTGVFVSDAQSLPDEACKQPEKSLIVVSSERLDAIIAAVYKMSRTQSQKLFAAEKVFANSRLILNTSYEPKTGEIISVRGQGRFIYESVERETKKGRLRCAVRIYK